MQFKKSAVILMCLVAITFGLIAALLVVRSHPSTAIPSSQDAEASVPVYKMRGSIAGIKITLDQKNFYTLSSISYENGMAQNAALSDYDEQIVNQSRIAGVLNASRELYALELLLESPDDYQPFGLSLPRAEVEITDETKQTITLLIGDNAPGNNGIYVKRKDSSAIYLVPAYSLENYLLPETAYLNLCVTPGTSVEGFDAMVLGGTVRQDQGEVTIRKEEGEYFITSPVHRPLEQNIGLAILNTLLGFNADNIAVINPTRDDLKVFELDTPYATAEVSGSWGDFFLSVSAPNPGGVVFLYREGVPLIYVAQEDLLPWLDLQYAQLMDSFACTPNIDNMKKITLDLDKNESYVFNLSRNENNALSVTLNGNTIDADNFLKFYVTLISAKLTEHTDESPNLNQQPELKITYTDISNQSQYVEFYPYTSRRYFIRAGDEPFFLTTSTYINRVLEDLKKIISGISVESIE